MNKSSSWFSEILKSQTARPDLVSRVGRSRVGFTLMELLLVIAIIGVLSTMALGVMRQAQVDAKTAATNSRIQMIEAIFAVELEDYEVRRLPGIDFITYAQLNPNHFRPNPNDLTQPIPYKFGFQATHLRRQVLLDLINAELPRAVANLASPSGYGFALGNYTDVGQFPSRIYTFMDANQLGFTDWLDASGNYSNPSNAKLSQRLRAIYLPRVKAFQRKLGFDEDGVNGGGDGFDDFDLPGEYLYAILEQIYIDGTPAIETLGSAAIGNSDGDRHKEVVDAWGEPMEMRIWQVRGIERDEDPNLYVNAKTAPGTDIWEDLDPEYDFLIKDSSGIPKGYTLLDPKQSRELTKIKIEIVSSKF